MNDPKPPPYTLRQLRQSMEPMAEMASAEREQTGFDPEGVLEPYREAMELMTSPHVENPVRIGLEARLTPRIAKDLAENRPERVLAELELLRRVFNRAVGIQKSEVDFLGEAPERSKFDDDDKYNTKLEEHNNYINHINSIDILLKDIVLATNSITDTYLHHLVKTNYSAPSPQLGVFRHVPKAAVKYLVAFRDLGKREIKAINERPEEPLFDFDDPLGPEFMGALARQFASHFAVANREVQKKALWARIEARANGGKKDVKVSGESARKALTVRLDTHMRAFRIPDESSVEATVARLLYIVCLLDASAPGWHDAHRDEA